MRKSHGNLVRWDVRNSVSFLDPQVARKRSRGLRPVWMRNPGWNPGANAPPNLESPSKASPNRPVFRDPRTAASAVFKRPLECYSAGAFIRESGPSGGFILWLSFPFSAPIAPSSDEFACRRPPVRAGSRRTSGCTTLSSIVSASNRADSPPVPETSGLSSTRPLFKSRPCGFSTLLQRISRWGACNFGVGMSTHSVQGRFQVGLKEGRGFGMRKMLGGCGKNEAVCR